MPAPRRNSSGEKPVKVKALDHFFVDKTQELEDGKRFPRVEVIDPGESVEVPADEAERLVELGVAEKA